MEGETEALFPETKGVESSFLSRFSCGKKWGSEGEIGFRVHLSFFSRLGFRVEKMALFSKVGAKKKRMGNKSKSVILSFRLLQFSG